MQKIPVLLQNANNFKLKLTIILSILFCSENVVCCIYSKATKNNFTREANIMNPDQTAPKRSSLIGINIF